ncbi:MAG: hypothetical protein OXG85_03860 [Chloroflexi bacterium]|nr:hypothetical protein [Chloroflexota bacterium]
MNRRYSLNTKINALNELDEHDGDVARVSEFLEIPSSTLSAWLRLEDELRRRYRRRLQRQRDRLTLDLQVEMLQRGKSILARMDAETLSKAPLNQLASALGSLVGQALKLEEAVEDLDESEEQVVRFEFYYDGQVQDAPPWADRGDGQPRAFQGGGLRPALGQDRAGQNGAAPEQRQAKKTGLVAGADAPDGEPSLARSENERRPPAGHFDQRERTAD